MVLFLGSGGADGEDAGESGVDSMKEEESTFGVSY
jgi:hypothetical protein